MFIILFLSFKNQTKIIESDLKYLKINYNTNIDKFDIENKSILEIGPGTGSLTKEILKRSPKKIIVVEKDQKLSSLLNKEYGAKLKIINDDILKIDETNLENEPLTVFGNLPYNISTKILAKLLVTADRKKNWEKILR